MVSMAIMISMTIYTPVDIWPYGRMDIWSYGRMDIWTLYEGAAATLLQLGSRGFHRAETVNLEWNELRLVFFGTEDSQTTGKGRYNGAVIKEKVTHTHSTYGPLCQTGAIALSTTDDARAVLVKLHHNFSNWLRVSGRQGVPGS